MRATLAFNGLNMDIENLTKKTAVNNLKAELDKMYLKDESSQAYETWWILNNRKVSPITCYLQHKV